MKVLLLTLGICLFTASAADWKPPAETVLSRFLRYVKIDTQSAEDQTTVPSTRKQLDLARLLESELKVLGAEEIRLSDFGILYAKIPGNLADSQEKPVLGLIAHMDTSPEVSGANVKPIIHTNYQGGDIVLPGDRTQIILASKTPVLKELIGDDIISSDGTTLLGSDDKAGCAAIMTLVDTLRQNPQIRHGTLAIAFTPDEEVGTGIEKFDVKGFGAHGAYTVDGKELGELNEETWNAKTATVTFKGKNTHPGLAKGIMTNSIYAAAYFLSHFPTNALPENTEDRVGFMHPYTGKLEVEESNLKILLRDFDRNGIEAKENSIQALAKNTQQLFPGVGVRVNVKEDYKNMSEVLKHHPELLRFAEEATRRAGLVPKRVPVRGGTDGANLSFAGLPCPDLFTGGQNFHGKLEFNSRRGLEKTTEMLTHLVEIFAEKL